MSLYTKYRPRDWDSVIDQDSIVTILRSSLKNGTTGHAYIFTGSRGTGKTTSARILAKSLNCLNLKNGNPCHECSACQAFDAGNMVDIIEIDGASNNGVENVRDLIEKAKFEPSMGKNKIYIIDEVHMLSTGAFNALLKILEEPPAHVKFILATTEIHKVPETIQSRSHRFDFHKISLEWLQKRLQFVAENEWIQAEKWTLGLIAKIARGGMRDALTLLEQYSVDGVLSLEYLKNSLSLVDENFVSEVIDTLVKKDYETLGKILEKIQKEHMNAENFFEQALLTLRDKMREHIASPSFANYNAILLIFRSAFSALRSIPESSVLLEITLMQAINYGNPEVTPVKNTIEKHQKTEEKILKNPEIIATKKEKTPPTIKEETPKIAENKFGNMPEKLVEKAEIVLPKTEEKKEIKAPIPETEETPQTSEFSYRKLLENLKSEPAILATLKTASFKNKGNHIDFTFTSKWNVDKMNESRYQNAILNALEKSFGGNWTIAALHSNSPEANNDLLDDIF